MESASDSGSATDDDHRIGVQSNDYYRLVQTLWQGHSLTGKTAAGDSTSAAETTDTAAAATHINFRTLVDLSLTQSVRLRNSQKRNIKISDLLIFPLGQRGFSHAVALVVRSASSDSPYLYYGSIRAKNADVCPHAAIAAYLFCRLHIPDDYGTLEMDGQLHKATNTFNESRLLRGTNKLQAISYTQQHRTIVSALQRAGISDKNINIGKLAASRELLTPNDKPASINIDNLPEETLYRVAGFSLIEDYKIKRDMLEPPTELLKQIFPFINDDNLDSFDIFTIRMKNVLGMLRRSLLQDMVVLRKAYPNNAISKHPIFNSDLFNDFASKLEEMGGTDDQISAATPPPVPNNVHTSPVIKGSPVHTPPITQVSPTVSPSVAGSANGTHNTESLVPDIRYIMDVVHRNEHHVNALHHQMEYFIRQQTGIYHDLHAFINQQNDFFSKQAEALKSRPDAVVDNVMNDALAGTFELITRLNGSQQAFYSAVNNPQNRFPDMHKQGSRTPIPQPFGSLVHPMPIHHTPQQVGPHISPVGHFTTPQMMGGPPVGMQMNGGPIGGAHMGALQLHGGHMGPQLNGPPTISGPAMAPPIMIPESEYSMRRRHALHRRLSRQASNVYEMWDDFKSLEKELDNNEILITEWLKLHGSSERQFRHTRQKIIRFIEEEAIRQNTSVEVIKDKLHSKMRNRAKPSTLDEVQRMLTSGKRINLD